MASKRMSNSEIKLTPIKLLSPLDLARYVSDSYLQNAPVMLIKNASGRYSIVAYGENLKKSRIAYYAELQSKPSYMAYRIIDGKEKLSFSADAALQEGIHFLRIVPIEMQYNKFSFSAKPKVLSIYSNNAISLAKHIALRSSMNEMGTDKVYSFIKDGERFIGSFDVMPEDDIQTFVYAKMHDTKIFNFFRYNYTADTIEETDALYNSSDVYVRVINLAEPFPFVLDMPE
ncbi:MAG: hypothetical protein QXN59_00675 [Candidatus Micrarchaeaceae archaeon]